MNAMKEPSITLLCIYGTFFLVRMPCGTLFLMRIPILHTLSQTPPFPRFPHGSRRWAGDDEPVSHVSNMWLTCELGCIPSIVYRANDG